VVPGNTCPKPQVLRDVVLCLSNFTLQQFMKDFTTYLSTAPVVATVWFAFTAGLLIEINRFFPDPLVFSF
jgi:photosystem I subunit IX